MSINRGIELASKYPLVALGGVGAALFAGSKMLGQNAGKRMGTEVLDQLMLSQALKSGLSTGAKWGLGIGIPAIVTAIGTTIWGAIVHGRLKSGSKSFTNMLKAMWHSTFFGDEKELKKLVDETTTTSKKGGNASANNSFPKKEYMKAWWKADPEKNKAYNEAKKELEKLKDEQKELDRDIDKNYSSMKALQAEDSIKTVTKALAKLRFYNDKIAEKESKFFQVGNAQKRAERLKELKKDRDNQYDFVRKEMGDPKNLVYTDREIQDLQINPSHYDKDYIKSHVGDRADQLRNKFDTVKDNLEKAQKKFDKADTELKEHNARKQAAQDKDDAAQRITDAEEKHRIALEAAQEATKTAQDEKKAAEEALRKAQQPSS